MDGKLKWDVIGTREYENGTDRGVLYPMGDDGVYKTGVAWNGLIGVNESPSGADANDLWADNMKYATLRSAEDFSFTIEAYTYPEEFAACDGSVAYATGVYVGQQARQGFGFAYRTKVGNDTSTENDDGYKLHLIYGCTASPSSKDYGTVNDNPDAITFSWECDTTPVELSEFGLKPSATIVINSKTVDPDKLSALEAKLYGSESAEASLPTLPEVLTLLGEDAKG
jgi:hypothetical protein